MFITEFPFTNATNEGLNLFDYFYNLDSNSWTRFDDTQQQARMLRQYNHMQYSLQSVANVTVPTVPWVRMLYQIECLVVAKKPVLVCGQGATGKSSLVKSMIFN